MDWKFSENLAQNLPAFYEKQRYNLEWPSVSGCKPIVYGMTRNMNKNDLVTFYYFYLYISYFFNILAIEFQVIGSSNPESVTGLEQDHVCSTCGAQYSTLKGLEVHEKVHGEPEELCHLCSERFYSKQQLKVCVLRDRLWQSTGGNDG